MNEALSGFWRKPRVLLAIVSVFFLVHCSTRLVRLLMLLKAEREIGISVVTDSSHLEMVWYVVSKPLLVLTIAALAIAVSAIYDRRIAPGKKEETKSWVD